MLITFKKNTITPNRSISLNITNNVYSYKSRQLQDIVSFGCNKDTFNIPQDELIKKITNSLLDPQNQLGVGSEARVIKIEDTGYCVRIPHNAAKDYRLGFISPLTESDKINHAVAKLGHKTTVMPIIEGYTLYPQQKDITRKMVHSMIDEMPVSVYKKLINQVANAKSNGLYVDCSGANIIVNPIKKDMTIIDFSDTSKCTNYDILKSLFSMFTIPDGLITKTQQKDRASKLLTATIEYFEPKVKPNFIILNDSFSKLFYEFRNLKLISTEYANLFNKIFTEMTNFKFQELHNIKDIEPQLNGHLKITKTLVKQLLAH